jgi:DNA-binding response OmpR family regulator
VELSRTQFRLLAAFLRNVGRTLTRQQLLDAAFEGDYDGFERTIDAHIRRLRRAIERDPANPEH